MSDALSARARRALRVHYQETYAEPKPEGAALPRKPVRTGVYDGAELREYTGRPGAMDAYRLPSRGLA